jgi:nicotinamidase-related amidase
MSFTEPHFRSSALLTIDVQNDFTLAGAPAEIPGTTAVLPRIVSLLRVYRARGLPIVHIVRLYAPDGSNAELCRRERIRDGDGLVLAGSTGSELVATLRPRGDALLDPGLLLEGGIQAIGPGEVAIYKPRWGAFYLTPLEAHLRGLGVDTLVFCGCNFPNCPRSSVYEASERDFRLVLATDAVSGLYVRGREELAAIGVALMTAEAIIAAVGSGQGGA